MESTQNPKRSTESFTFEQIEAGCAILRRYASAVIAEYNEGGEVYELDFLREIAAVLARPKATR